MKVKVKIIANKKQLKEWSLHSDFKKDGVYEVLVCEEPSILKWYKCIRYGYNIPSDFVEVISETPNRDFLRDFCTMNNIKKTLVSKALGKSENWLTQMVNDKRRDMTDETLQSILKQLHIDWSSQQWLQVKAHDGCVEYHTRPYTYTTEQHKERLQRDFWNGLVTK